MGSLIPAMKSMQTIIKDTDLTVEKDYVKRILQQLENASTQTQVNHSEILNFLSTTTTKIEEDSVSLNKQYKSDFEIVSRINNEIDEFRVTHNTNVELLISNLSKEIINEIDEYKKEITQKLNPHKIGEFSTKSEFEFWLATVNENYLNIMNRKLENNVNYTTKSYLWEFEKVLINTSNYLKDRPNYIDFENDAYGSLSKSKANIVKATRNQIIEYNQVKGTLTDASGDFFDGVHNAKQAYDRKVTAVSAGGALVAGAAAGLASATAISSAGATAAATLSGSLSVVSSIIGGSAVTISAPVWIPVMAGATASIVAMWVAYDFLKDKSGQVFEDKLNKEFEKHRMKFEKDVEAIKVAMCKQITEKVTLIFDNELKSMEKTFMQYRIVVNIDSKRVSMIETEIRSIKEFLEQNQKI